MKELQAYWFWCRNITKLKRWSACKKELQVYWCRNTQIVRRWGTCLQNRQAYWLWYKNTRALRSWRACSQKYIGLSLFLIIACSSCGGGGGGGSGSSAPRDNPIPAIHGLWLEADACNCRVHVAAEKKLADGGVNVRCYHYFAPSGGKTRAASGYIRFGAKDEDNVATAKSAQSCDGSKQLTQSQAQAIRDELGKLIARDVAFLLPSGDLPNGIGSLVYATASMRNSTDLKVTIARSGHSEDGQTRDGEALDFRYTSGVAETLGRQPGGNGIICSSYWKKNNNELYIGVPGSQHDPSCRRVARYTQVERYIKAP